MIISWENKMIEIKVPEWFLKTKEINSLNCNQTYKDTLRNKLGIKFSSQTDSKSILLDIASRGGAKPRYETSLYIRLCSCTNKNYIQFDKDFNKKIRELRPDWFLPRSLRTENKKIKLLSLAKNKKPRPSHKEKLYRDFCCYTNKKNKRYDKVFDKKIRRLRPDWFLTRPEVAAINKKKILSLKTKPKRSTKLGVALKNYISKSSQAYDANFNKQVHELKPHWFTQINN